MIETWGFLIMAAGRGTRLGGVPKQFRPLGGKDVWRWSLDLARSLNVDQIVLVVPEETEGQLSELCKDLLVTSGGSTRTESVIRGLERCDADWVLIHDGARPFASKKLCRSIMDSVQKEEGVIPVVPVYDAVKRVEGDELETVDRSRLFLTQTPQAFHRLSLLNLLKRLSVGSKDEAEPWIESGKRITTVVGEKNNFKITTEEDWEMAQSVVSSNSITRNGLGFDVHPLVPGRPLILGGIEFNSPLGLYGHSDGDLICHSISDGILGAAGLPDIGRLFPATDPIYRGANSYGLLLKVISMAQEKGWEVQWVDVVLHAQIPRIGERVVEIVDNLNKAWGADSAKVNLKVKSGENVGPVGQGNCMTCYASVTAQKYSGCAMG